MRVMALPVPIFQSTLPARGATRRTATHKRRRERFQSTLPARGATCGTFSTSPGFKISIHAPRTGSDDAVERFYALSPAFQSTLPARGATPTCVAVSSATPFQSTLPARGATLSRRPDSRTSRFQSTLPARGATCLNDRRIKNVKFQSTLPARGATRRGALDERGRRAISIHAPRTGSD